MRASQKIECQIVEYSLWEFLKEIWQWLPNWLKTGAYWIVEPQLYIKKWPDKKDIAKIRGNHSNRQEVIKMMQNWGFLKNFAKSKDQNIWPS